MASTTTKPEKRLVEFLKEQQEPFILEVYLLEKGYSKRWSSNSKGDSHKSFEKSASSCSNEKRKYLLPFPKVLKALHKKLIFHNKSSAVIEDSDNRKEHVGFPHEAASFDRTVVEAERFSTASTSTMFHSCSDIDEDGASSSSQKDKPWFSPDTCKASSVCNMRVQSQQAPNNGLKHRQRCIGGRSFPLYHSQTISLAHKTLNHDASGMEKRISSCGVVVPKKITEDSLLSSAIWSLLIQSAKRENYNMELREILGPNVSQILKSKRALHKTKQLLFDYVREITITFPTNDDRQQGCQQFMGPEELGKIICERTKEWGQQVGDKTNLTYLLTLDYMNSINEWSKFDQHVKDISVDIADAILERVINEIVSDMIENLPPTTTIYNKLNFLL